MRKIALLANHFPGVEISRFLASSREDSIHALYLVGEDSKFYDDTVQSSGVVNGNIFTGKDVFRDADHINWFKLQNFDAIICVYWPWILSSDFFSNIPITINFHPALLPVNRGWFPHVHSIIDGSQLGVTLHKLSEKADTGEIWVQKEIKVLETEDAKEIYDRLQTEIIELFKNNWEKITANQIECQKQNECSANYHKKSEINFLDEFDPKENMSFDSFIKRLRARSFGKRSFAYYFKDGKKYFVRIQVSEKSDFRD
jgi:methionyl-tRNA formyltransferase